MKDRPCERCIQRGLAETCRDGTRKKAKYLLADESKITEEQNPRPTNTSQVNHLAHQASDSQKPQFHPQFSAYSYSPNFNNSLTPSSSTSDSAPIIPAEPYLRNYSANNDHQDKFQSSALNSEYDVLIDMMNQVQDFSDIHEAVEGMHYDSSEMNHYTLDGSLNVNVPDILSTKEDWMNPLSAPAWLNDTTIKRPISFAIANESLNTETNLNSFFDDIHKRNYIMKNKNNNINNINAAKSSWKTFRAPGDIYSGIKKPFSYTPGYHALVAYLRTRFDREQLMKMARCMATYRPSFIACTNTLQEDDLIFMEQCFQRTLMEYEKFISYSGTPTIVWRRTGEVTAVGKEFCILTGWSRERILNRQTFIVELMDDRSVVDYFEMFSNIAFGDSRGAMMAECTLLTPQGQNLKTCSMLTLKRDVFGIPMMIIGNFLPILT